MKKKMYKKLLTGLLCAVLLSADLMPAGAVTSAAEETFTEAESEFETEAEEEASSLEEYKSEEPVTEDIVTEGIVTEETVTEETETIDESATETETEAEEAETQELLASDDIASGSYKNISWLIDNNGKLTVTGTGDFSDSKYATDRAPWYEYRASIKSAEVNVTGMTDASYMFADCSNLTTLNLSSFDTHNVTDMRYMFQGCKSLTNLDLSNFDTANVTWMYDMFSKCSSLTELNLSNFDTANTLVMEGMFSKCSSLTELNLSSFNTANVTNMGYMFSSCGSLTELNLSSFNTVNVGYMGGMFSGCTNLTELNLSSFDTHNVTNMSYMFCECSSLTELNLSSFDTTNVTDMNFMFQKCKSLVSLDLSSFNAGNVELMFCMFQYCNSLTELNLSNFDTRNITNTGGMFVECSSLTELNLSSFDTTNVDYMGGMFRGCSSLTELNLSSFDTHNVAYMHQMFYGCSNLTSLDISSFNTDNVIDMHDMFCGCSSLTELNLSNFDTANVTDMSGMFSGCSSLTELNLSSFNTHNVTNMAGMFGEFSSIWSGGCSSLTELNLSSFDTRNVTNMNGMFYDCSSLTELNLSNFDMRNTTMHSMFYDCSSLSSIQIPDGIISIAGSMFSRCDSLSSIEIPDSVTSIDDRAFEYCYSLYSIEIPDSVTRIGTGAFSYCTGLYSIEISNGVTCIDAGAFSYCRHLHSIEIPISITDIGYGAFDSCSNLHDVYYGGYEDDWNAINIDSGNNYLINAAIHYASTEIPLQTIEGILRSGDGWKINWKCTYKLDSNDIPRNGKVEITINNIGDKEELYLYNETGEAFPWELAPYNIPKSAISTLIIRGNSMKKLRITTNSFKGYSSLYSITLSSVSGVDSGAFEGCGMLNYVNYSNGADPAFIGKGAFKNCYLTRIDLPDNLQSIGAEAFQNTALKTITLGSSIEEIGKDAFSGCKNLRISCVEGSYAHQYAQENNLPFELISTEITYYIHYGSGKTEKFKHDLDYYVSRTVSTTYNPQLSHMLIALSNAVYNENNIRASLKELGFKDRDIHCRYGTNDWDELISYAFGKKTMSNGKTLVLVAIKGSPEFGFNLEWLSNAALGTTFTGCSWHAGLEQAVNEVYRDLSSFVGGNLDNTTFVVTGHSRGAAVANLLEIKLFDAKVAGKNVYGYNFACPDVATGFPTGWNWFGEHNNIFNIGNAADPVSVVPGAFASALTLIPTNSWGKFGQSRWFAKNWNNLSETTLNFSAHDQEVYLEHLRTEPSFNSFKTWEERVISITSSQLQTIGRLFNICCPVDVSITDSNGNIVASVTDDIPNYHDSAYGDVIILTNGDKKAIFVKGNEPLTVHLTATDNGTMEYTAQTINADTLETLAEKTFSNVTLTEGKQMTSIVDAIEEENISMAKVPLFVLDNNGEPEKEVLPDGKGTEISVANSDWDGILPEDVPADGKIPDGLWIAAIKDISYTGKAVKPAVRVYNSDKRLKEGQDYTISYKNNVNANDASNASTAPTVAVKGKGNYTGTETAQFKILPVNLNDSSVIVEDITVSYNGKVQKKAPVVTFNGKKLSGSKDFTVSYPSQGTEKAYQTEGAYDILLTAKEGGNFTGTRTVKLIITSNTLISKASIKKIPNQPYTGNAITPALTVTLKKAVLVENQDYTVSYENNTNTGTATVILTGIGTYAGTKKVTFKINGTPLKNVSVTGIEDKIYNGKEQTQNISVQTGGVTLNEGTDYTLIYSNRRDVGKVTVTIKGSNAYTGTVKKTFRIAPYDLSENAGGQIKGLDNAISAKYVKGGSKPRLQLTFADEALTEGIDYTLSYQNNKAVTSSDTKKQPCVIITGKGNFKGAISKGFTISKKALNDTESPVTLTVPDKGFADKAGNYISTPVLTDADGVKLAAGNDYESNIVYTLTDGTVLTNKDTVAANKEVIVKVTGKGAYSGELTAVYRITENDFSKAKISITPQIYTGREITLDKNSVSVKIGKDTLLFGTDYEIAEGSYIDNIKKGTAKVTIIGKGKYGGSKTVKFTIAAKGFLWWWRKG